MAGELTFDNAVDVLVARVPELRSIYQELLDDEGPPVRHYGFIDLSARFAQSLAALAPDDPAGAETLHRLAAVLEEMAASKEPYLPDLMGAGFVEALDPNAPGFNYLVGLMGPASREQVVSWFGPDSV